MPKHADLVEQFKPYILSGATVFDVGANVGDYTAAFAELVGIHGHVVAFEPGPRVCDEMLYRLRRDHPDFVDRRGAVTPRIVIRQVALGSDDGRAAVVHYRHWILVPPNPVLDLAHVVCGDDTERFKESVPFYTTIETLDDQPRSRSVSFIKIDVDGWELRVLRGAAETISDLRPSMYVEYCPFAIRAVGDEPADVLSFLFALPDYTIRTDDGVGLRSPYDVDDRIRASEDSVNLFLIPREWAEED